ncbi:hypothetical protein C8Q77DRAFT_1128074 [Trametes polyzona]|nr:hypothetical protein C8Q77DRAFT_1128074 [Trametes polyzona]
MSWASMRETTRDEDQAYCLMGIFGVNIPTIYGEGGERAFVRLQEEIMRRIPDTTLFAWGPHGDPVRTMVGYRSVFPTASLVGESLYTERSCLLAPSPAAFKDCSDLQVMTRKDFGAAYKTVKEAALHHPAFTTTSHGIQASCPAIHFPGACALLLLPCCRVRRGKTLLVALVLRFQGEEWPWSVGVRIVEEELTLVSKHGRALARVAEGLAARPPFVVRAQSHVDVRYVLLPKDFDFGRCLQRPVNQGDQHPFPTWDTKNYIAYRTEDVFRPLQRLNAMQESKPLQPLRARRHNLFFPKWVITGLEENGYTAPKLSGNSTSCMPLVVHSGQRLAVPFFDRDGKIKTEQMRLDIRADVPSPEAKEAALWCNVEFLSDGTEYKVSADEQRQDTHASKKVEPDGIFSRRLNEEGRPGAGDRAGSSAPSPADEEDVNVRAGFVDLWKHSGRQGRKEFSNGVWRFLITFTRLFNSDIHDAASPRTNNSYLVDIILSHSDA